MAVLDNAIWLTGTGSTAANGSTVISDGPYSTTVVGTFTGTWEADPGGYTGVTDFGAFGVTSATPTVATYEFSEPVENVSFDFNHISDDGGSLYDDLWTIHIYDENGVLVPSADVIAALTGMTDEIVFANPDGSVSIEAQGTGIADVNFNLTGYSVSEIKLELEAGPNGTESGGSGISDISFDIPAPDTDGDGVADDVDIDIDGDGILNENEGIVEVAPSTITITFDGDDWSGDENTWELRDASGTLIASGNPADIVVETTDVTVTDLGDYTFTVYDTFGDGISGGTDGSFQIAIDGTQIYDSGTNFDFGTQHDQVFAVETTETTTDTDGDGIADHLDLDSDNDGITDNVEMQTTAGYIAPTGVDMDGDGVDDAYDATPTTGAAGSIGLVPVDTDGDGTADYLDTDSDNDGILDVDEAGHGVSQATIDASGDADGDGIKDAVDDVVGHDVNDADVNGSGEFTLADSDGDTAADGTGATPTVNDLDFRDAVQPDYIVEGTTGNDLINDAYAGDQDGDKINSNDHSDGSNDDLVYANDGNDTVLSGDGNDTVYGGDGADSLSGGDGDDIIHGGGDPTASTGGTDALSYNYSVFHLGLAPEADVVDGDAVMDDPNAFLGTYGGPGNELYHNIQTATTVDTDGNTRINNADTEAPAETVTINGVDHTIDVGQTLNATVTFDDGTTASVSLAVVQTTDGNLYVFPEPSNTADHAVLTSKPIESISLDSVSQPYVTISSERMDGDYALPGDTDTSGDSIDGGAGNDTVYGGVGNDSIDGDAGADELYGGSGEDEFIDGAGDDTLYGGDEKDRFDYTTITGNDTVVGGEVNDTTPTDSGDKLDAHNNTDNLTVTFTGDEAGTMTDGTDTVTFSEIEHIMLGTGTDTIDASASTVGQILDGGEGADTITGSQGDDYIAMGLTQDFSATDGDNDVLILTDGFGNDTIEGFEAPTDNGDGTFTGKDTVNVTGLTDAGGDPVLTNDVTVTDDGSGNTLLTFPNGESLVLLGINPTDADDPFYLNAIGIPMPDGTVSGTSGADTIDSFYLGDPDGDMVDNNDAIILGDIGDDDLIEAGAGDDRIYAGDGHDEVYAGADNDTITGGAGDDVLFGGADNDMFILGDGDGADTITGGETGTDEDTIDFDNTAGVDVVYTGNEAGTATDGTSNVTFSEIENLHLTDAADTVDASADALGVNILAGDGANSILGGSGDDSVWGGVDQDTLSGGAGNDQLDGEGGKDVLDGGAGDDVLVGDAGNDSLTGGTGADGLYAGTGDDTVTFSEGDSAYGDTGDDLFVLEDLGETSNGTITIDGGAGDETGGDTLQIGSLGTLTQAVRDTFVDDGTGSYSGSITLDDGTILNFSEIENIICFTPGTCIATPNGLVAIEDLSVGDKVVTRDHGLQPIRWIEARTVPAVDRFAPIKIRNNVLSGQDRELIVSPQHRVLFQGYRAELLFGESEVLVAAKHLIDGIDVTQDESETVTYIHMLFDHHEIIYAEGAATESFHPGDIGFSAVSDAAREELFAIFPELRVDPRQYGNTARRCLMSHEAKLTRT